MPALDSTEATLRFIGDDLIPEDISNLLGCKPTGGEAKGDMHVEVMTGQTLVSESGSWYLKAPTQDDGNLDSQITTLLDKLPSELSIWHNLTSTYNSDIFCGLFMQTDDDGLRLQPTTMRMLAERGLMVEMCIYTPEEDDFA